MNLSTPLSPWTYPFMNQRYLSFSKLWKPQWMPSLFVVRVPEEVQELGEKTYLALMQTRLDIMIQHSVQEASLQETQQLLASSLEQIEPVQLIPLLATGEDDWRQSWSETLILNTWRFQEQLGHYGVNFPATDPMDLSHPEYADWLALHEETTLEDWLVNLIP
ncbi:MAG: hypothetical protein AAFR99_21975 [Cyanobacteria bacterium J06629_9]